jgi:hypothetical protein
MSAQGKNLPSLKALVRRPAIIAACLLLAACLVIGADHYRTAATLRAGKEVIIADRRDPERVDWQAFPRIFNSANPGKLVEPNGDADSLSLLVGGDTCGSATAIGELPYNDSGTTVGMADDYDLPVSISAPTVTGCPSCDATGGGPPDAAPRGGVFLGTGTGPDAAYSISFSSSNNSIDVTLTPTGSDDLALIVYTDVCSSSLSDAIVVDDDNAGGEAEHVTISNMPAGTYNIVVDAYSTGGTPPGPSGPYSIAITGSGTIVGGATPTDTPTPSGSPSISGTVTYGNAAAPPKYISNATVTGTGSPVVTTTTAASGATAGQYTLNGFGAGAYTVSLSKITGQNGITSNDAARIAQHVASTVPLTTNNQKVTADVTGNGAVSSQDAAKIAQYVAALPVSPPNLTGTWQFYLPPGPTFPVGSSPTSRTYPTVTGDLTGEDYIGLLIGEVTGNWTNTGARPANGPVRSTSVELPNLTVEPGKQFVIPVSVGGAGEKDVISYEFDLRYDPKVITPQVSPVDVTGTASRGLSTAVNAGEPGLLRVVLYGPLPVDDRGVLLNLKFTVIGEPGSFSPLTWESIMFNEGDPQATATDGQVQISADSRPDQD